MELKNFVSQTIQQIMDGYVASQKHVEESNAFAKNKLILRRHM